MSQAAVAASTDTDDMSKERANEIVQQYKMMRQEVQQYAGKIGEMDGERKEHQLVIDAIKDLDKDRRCFRLVGGVLVERTVGEILPAVTQNLEALTGVCAALKEKMEVRSSECQAFQLKYNIGRGDPTAGAQQAAASSSSSSAGGTGVLV